MRCCPSNLILPAQAMKSRQRKKNYLCDSFVNKKPYVALLSKNKASVYIGVKVK